jgi:putative ABC transport system ATP-binding protein
VIDPPAPTEAYDRDIALRCSDLFRHFHRGDSTVRAVDGLTFEVGAGELVGVVGTSGSGKTTLLNLVGGLDTPSGGVLEVFGRTLHNLEKDELAAYRREVVGIVFQAFHLLGARTARENVELPLMLAGMPIARRRERAQEALIQVGLEGRSDHRPDELSGGEQQRVAIARALVRSPRLLLADEPTGNLDSRTGREILGLIARLNAEHGLTVLLVSHDEQAIGRITGRIIRLSDGRLVTQGAA